jgi:hypothetical protein
MGKSEIIFLANSFVIYMSLRTSGLARLVFYGQHSSDTIGVNWWRGPPNNHLQDTGETPHSNPQIHLNNDACKFEKTYVATLQLWGKYDMKANNKEG